MLSISFGILLWLAFPPFKTGFFAYIGLVPLLILLDRLKNYYQVLRYSYLGLVIFHALTIYWIGGWSAKTDVFMQLGSIALILIHPIFYWIPISIYFFIKKYFRSRAALFFFPFLWNAIEYIRSVEETAFPWLTLGNTQSYYLPIIQITSFIGVYGLSFLIVVFNVLIFIAYKNYRFMSLRFALNKIAIVVIILLVIFIYGKVVINDVDPPGKRLTVGVIQPDLDPWDKWEEGDVNSQLSVYLTLSDSAVKEGAELIVWPETALPVYLVSERYPGEVARIRKFVAENNVHLLTGLPLVHFYFSKEEAKDESRISRDSTYYYDSYNGAVLFSPNEDKLQEYGKMKLVPFAERAPYLHYLPFLGDWIKWGVGISNWSVWDKQTVFEFKDSSGDSIKFSVGVCYESIFPAFNAEFVKNGAQFIVVVTNDSWYGELAGPYQHKEFAVFRAVENRRWIVRAANGGISCLIDPIGVTTDETKLYTRRFLVGEIYIKNETTFYTQYQDIISYVSVVVSILIFVMTFIRKIKMRKYNVDN
jgi:apolipoprotein N-acyltransferase